MRNCPYLLDLIPRPSSFKNLKKIEVRRCQALENLAVNTPIEYGVHLHEEVSFLQFIYFDKNFSLILFLGSINKNIP